MTIVFLILNGIALSRQIVVVLRCFRVKLDAVECNSRDRHMTQLSSDVYRYVCLALFVSPRFALLQHQQKSFVLMKHRQTVKKFCIKVQNSQKSELFLCFIDVMQQIKTIKWLTFTIETVNSTVLLFLVVLRLIDLPTTIHNKHFDFSYTDKISCHFWQYIYQTESLQTMDTFRDF